MNRIRHSNIGSYVLAFAILLGLLGWILGHL